MIGEASASSLGRRVDAVLSRRGGDAQRATARTRLGPPRESAVGKLLYFFFMWGMIPATIVQRIAMAMQADLAAVGAEVDPPHCTLGKFGAQRSISEQHPKPTHRKL